MVLALNLYANIEVTYPNLSNVEAGRDLDSIASARLRQSVENAYDVSSRP